MGEDRMITSLGGAPLNNTGQDPVGTSIFLTRNIQHPECSHAEGRA